MFYKILLSSVLLIAVAGCSSRYTPVSVKNTEFPIQFLDGATLTPVDYSQVLTELDKVDVVFIGEIHDDSLTHIVEYRILNDLAALSNQRAIALEMFERDVQGLLNDYLYDAVSEDEFLAGCRPWDNYSTDYRPLVELSKRRGMPVLAANVPRRYAASIAKYGEGVLASLPDSEKVWMAAELLALDDEYKERFMKRMGSMDMPQAMQKNDFENLYMAQCIKDDTMAESIALFLSQNPAMRIISFQGDFHSAFSLGVVKKLKLMASDVTMSVISIVPVTGDWKKIDPLWKNRAGFIVVVPRHSISR
ncbi:ChaN family lipoprotein [bacterium]|nr:ChaN family lipoprotein [bacterium]